MLVTLFAYGSLMFSTVWQEVVGRDFATAPAVLDGHTAFCVTGHTFPALVPDDPAASTSGLVYFDVDAESTARLDEFEGTFFHRVPVTVRLDSGETIPAEAFLAAPARRGLVEKKVWDPEKFRRENLPKFFTEPH